MNDDLSVNREVLLRQLNLVRPALSTLDYIPALKHIRLTDGYATAYNDVSAIVVALPGAVGNLDLCVPGETLLKTLDSFNAETVMLQVTDESTLLVSSGRSKIKVPTLPLKSFPLSLPTEDAATITVTASMLEGLRRCLLSVGNDPTRPATVGITLDVDAGRAVLFSTDNATISRFTTDSKLKLPGEVPIILPTFFCEQLLALSKLDHSNIEIEIELHAGALIGFLFNGDERNAMLFSKMLVDDVSPLDFPKIIRKHIGDSAALVGGEIPDAFDSAFQRALLILGNEQDKMTKVSIEEKYIRLLSTSPSGEASDSVSFPLGESHDDFFIDPALVARALKQCTHMSFPKKVMVMMSAGGEFLHMISHCS